MIDKEDLASIGIIWIITGLGYRTLQKISIVSKLEYWGYAPNRYRLFHQLLIYFHNNPLSVITLITLSFGLCMTAAYLIIRPKDQDLTLFIMGILLVGGLGYGYNALMYPILAIMGKYRDRPLTPLLLIPLVLTKEFAFFVAVVFLILYSRNKSISILSGIIASVVYLIVRFMVLGNIDNYPASAPLFTPFYMIQVINPWFLGIGFAVVLMMYLVTRTRNDILLVIATAIVTFTFALWWEPQLWVPTVILIFASRYPDLKEKLRNE